MMKRWKIGQVEIENPFVLAPMAGITDLPFRGLCKEMGAGLVYTEMVSAKAISYRNRNTIPLWRSILTSIRFLSRSLAASRS